MGLERRQFVFGALAGVAAAGAMVCNAPLAAQDTPTPIWEFGKVYRADGLELRLLVAANQPTWSVAITCPLSDEDATDAIVECFYWQSYSEARGGRLLLHQTATGPAIPGMSCVADYFSVPLDTVAFFRVRLLQGLRVVEVGRKGWGRKG